MIRCIVETDAPPSPKWVPYWMLWLPSSTQHGAWERLEDVWWWVRTPSRATHARPIDETNGMVVNLVDVKKQLREDVVAKLSGRSLDFPTPEALAFGIWVMLGGRLGGRTRALTFDR